MKSIFHINQLLYSIIEIEFPKGSNISAVKE